MHAALAHRWQPAAGSRCVLLLPTAGSQQPAVDACCSCLQPAASCGLAEQLPCPDRTGFPPAECGKSRVACPIPAGCEQIRNRVNARPVTSIAPWLSGALDATGLTNQTIV